MRRPAMIVKLGHESSSTASTCRHGVGQHATAGLRTVLARACTRGQIKYLTSSSVLCGGTTRQKQRQQLVRECPGTLRVAQLVQHPKYRPATMMPRGFQALYRRTRAAARHEGIINGVFSSAAHCMCVHVAGTLDAAVLLRPHRSSVGGASNLLSVSTAPLPCSAMSTYSSRLQV